MNSGNILSLFFGAFIVWIFNEYSKERQVNRERRAHIGRALSCLLTLHHRVRIIEDFSDHLATQLLLPESGRRAYKLSMEYVLPKGKEFVSQYEQAIDQLAETSPVIAFKLRERAKIVLILRAIPSMTAIQDISHSEIELVEKQIKEMLIPSLVQAIKELANLHGGDTRRQVNIMLNSPLEFPEELIGIQTQQS